MTNMRYIGKINRQIIEQEFGNIQTDDVVITDERDQHIKEQHLNDYDLFNQNQSEIINNPDYILKDEKHHNTIFVIKALNETNMNILIKLSVLHDEKHNKNSVITAYRLRDKNLKKLLKKHKLLYKKE